MLPFDSTAIRKLKGHGGPITMGGNQEGINKINNSNNILFDCEFECGNID